MRILSIASDKKLFENGSAVAGRQVKYGELVGSLNIVNLALRKDGFEAKKLSEKVTVFSTSSYLKIFYFWDAYQLAKKLPKPDLVTVQDPFETGFTALLVAKYFKCPLQVQIHTDFLNEFYFKESLKNKIRTLISYYVLPRANCVRVVSKRIKESIQKKFPNLKVPVDVLPIFVDISKFKPGLVSAGLRGKYPQFEFILLMASRLTREKNIALAIGAMRSVIERYPSVGLVIVGDGEEKENLESKVRGWGLGKNVIIEDWNNDLASYYKTADLFLNTSNYEGYGMAPVEALASGLPVLMTDVGIVGDIVKDRVNGLIVPVGDRGALERDILEFIENETLRCNVTAGAKETKFEGDEATYLTRYKQCWRRCVLW